MEKFFAVVLVSAFLARYDAQAQCSNDTDCKGSRVCVNGGGFAANPYFATDGIRHQFGLSVSF